MSEEWGPWVEHDGRIEPVDGTPVYVERANGDEGFFIAGTSRYKCRASVGFGKKSTSWWIWESDIPQYGEIIRYRIRKPRGMTILENLIADLPAPSLEPSPINETAPREELPV